MKDNILLVGINEWIGSDKKRGKDFTQLCQLLMDRYKVGGSLSTNNILFNTSKWTQDERFLYAIAGIIEGWCMDKDIYFEWAK